MLFPYQFILQRNVYQVNFCQFFFSFKKCVSSTCINTWMIWMKMKSIQNEKNHNDYDEAQRMLNFYFISWSFPNQDVRCLIYAFPDDGFSLNMPLRIKMGIQIGWKYEFFSRKMYHKTPIQWKQNLNSMEFKRSGFRRATNHVTISWEKKSKNAFYVTNLHAFLSWLPATRTVLTQCEEKKNRKKKFYTHLLITSSCFLVYWLILASDFLTISNLRNKSTKCP